MEAVAPPPLSEGSMEGIPSPQFALINYFFPGYSMLISTLNTALGADFERFLPYLLLVLGGSLFWNYCSGTVHGWIETYFMSSFTVQTDDEVYDILMLWTSRQTFAKNTRNFVANTNIFSRSGYMWQNDESDDDDGSPFGSEDDMLCDPDEDAASRRKHVFHFTPSAGRHWFWFKGHLLRFERQEPSNQNGGSRNGYGYETLSISCFGRDPTILKLLLREARSLYIKKDDLKTVIYRATSSNSSYGSEPFWQRCMSRPSRPFSTVILPDELKNQVIVDAGDYLDSATRRWYANRGIPYRRGYLLHGPPGTGKSSLSLALAGHFRMKIYIVSLSSVTSTEENLASLFSDLPNNCIVLLEDIDTAGLTHTREESAPAPTKEKPSDDSKKPANNSNANGQLSLSGLLNILDGVAAQEGRLLIMTTNHIEKLDKALIRPGRVDMIVPFRLANHDMVASIFKAIFTPKTNEVAHHDIAGLNKVGISAAEQEKRIQAHVDKVEERIATLSDEFADKMPEDEFSPAEIQGLLLCHKHDPRSAIASVDEWVTKTRLEKSQREQDKAAKEKKAQEEKIAQEESNKAEEAKKAQEETSESEAADTEAKSEDEPAEQNSPLEKTETVVAKKEGIQSKASSDSGYETP